MYTIFVVSDGTGRTAQQALNAALTQFSNITIDIIKFSEVRTKEQVLNVVEEAVK
ncbi:MAG: kinase/pyrophosphorylase, partial [Bacteroidales bacterium]|nr:kinase/pyrophosphorylase [Bacteroidales bacterium]